MNAVYVNSPELQNEGSPDAWKLQSGVITTCLRMIWIANSPRSFGFFAVFVSGEACGFAARRQSSAPLACGVASDDRAIARWRVATGAGANSEEKASGDEFTKPSLGAIRDAPADIGRDSRGYRA